MRNAFGQGYAPEIIILTAAEHIHIDSGNALFHNYFSKLIAIRKYVISESRFVRRKLYFSKRASIEGVIVDIRIA